MFFPVPGPHPGYHITFSQHVPLGQFWSVRVSQTFFVVHGLDPYEEYCSGIL